VGEMIILDVDKIKIVSLNKKYYGNFTLTREYRQFKNSIYNCLVDDVRIDPPYRVAIYVEMYHDIDNFLKPLFDAMQDKGIIGNDRDVIKLLIEKKQIKRGNSGRLFVEIENI
jgi:Holliday junction resolvase RusA-like endonuclease